MKPSSDFEWPQKVCEKRPRVLRWDDRTRLHKGLCKLLAVLISFAMWLCFLDFVLWLTS